MKTIKIALEYTCFPVWLYDENDGVIDTDMPPELADDNELRARFSDLQKRFDSTYVDNEKEFAYVGFPSENEKDCFFQDLENAASELEAKCSSEYTVERGYKMQ